MVYEWFNHLKKSEIAEITAFVIMPNHLHAILYFKDENFNLNNIIANAKRFMAYEIIERLKEQNSSSLLKYYQMQ
jgi:REP element-mobilizing transposase RayT